MELLKRLKGLLGTRGVDSGTVIDEMETQIREAMVLLVLDEAENRGLDPLPEIDLHQLVRHAQPSKLFDFRSSMSPIRLNMGFRDFMDRTKERCWVSMLCNSPIPDTQWRVYQLTPLGKSRAKEARQQAARLTPTVAPRVAEAVGQQAAFRQKEASIVLPEGFDNYFQLLFYIERNSGSDVSDMVDQRVREGLEKTGSADPLRIFDEIQQATRAYSVAPMSVRFRGATPAVEVT